MVCPYCSGAGGERMMSYTWGWWRQEWRCEYITDITHHIQYDMFYHKHYAIHCLLPPSLLPPHHHKVQYPQGITTGYNTFKHIHDRKERPRDMKRYGNQWQVSVCGHKWECVHCSECLLSNTLLACITTSIIVRAHWLDLNFLKI